MSTVPCPAHFWLMSGARSGPVTVCWQSTGPSPHVRVWCGLAQAHAARMGPAGVMFAGYTCQNKKKKYIPEIIMP